LREFDLEFAVVADCVLGENVEDQLGAIDHAQIEPLREVSRLGRAQDLIEDHEVDTALESMDHEFLEFSYTDDEARIHAITLLGYRIDDLYAGRLREFEEFGDVSLEFVCRPTRRDRNQDRTFGAADFARSVQAAEFVFDIANPRREIDIQVCGWRGGEQFDGVFAVGDGAQRSDVSQLRQAVRVYRDDDHRVEAQQCEVRQVVSIEAFVVKMCMNTAQSAKATTAGSQSTPVGKFDRLRRPAHHVGHFAAAIYENSDLAADLETDLRKFASEFVTDDAFGRNAAPSESLQPAYLAGLETAGVAVDLDGATSVDVLHGQFRGGYRSPASSGPAARPKGVRSTPEPVGGLP
jgi:hypothetical protein